MFLKALETVGFKSFADRITIEFVPGITTIVGPNGSGKSNIIDAIRWVLGEQSARSLRGQRMEDIIFQGSESRNALNFAEVSLILNNEADYLPIDYREVKVTRRVYRSGESEFLINKQACRLKDIIDLFTDTGLGRESFSIIGQGKIDEILSSKSEERRAVFEEAAGVMRYKKRKEEASFKLSETDENLSRVEDIIHEISQQIQPLKEQAEVAKQYQQLHEKLTEKEISLLVTEIDELHAEWTSLLTTIESEKLEDMKQASRLQKLDAQMMTRRQEVAQIENDLAQLQQQLLNITEQLEQTEGNRKLLIEKQKHQEENKEHLLQDQASLLAERSEIEEELQTERKRLSQIEKRIEEIRAAMQDLGEKLYSKHDLLTDEIENLKADYIEYLNEQAVLKNDAHTLQERQSQLERRLANHEADHAGLRARAADMIEQSKAMQSQLSQEADTLRKKERDLSGHAASLEKITSSIEAKRQAWYQLKDQWTKLTSRKEMLIEMKKNFQGFAYGVKEILQAHQAGKLSNIIGPVIDLIELPSRYMTAIDTILGGQAQYIVVPDDETARETIAWLKRENKGRATFLPIQSIVARSIPPALKEEIQAMDGYLGIASDLVKVEAPYRRVVEHLMGNVIVTKSLKDANRIAARTNRRYRIVTLDGDLVYPGGSISGGAQRKRQTSLFTREKEIDQLTKQITEIVSEQAKVEASIKADENKAIRLQKQIKELERTVQQLEDAYRKKVQQEREYRIKRESLEDQLQAYDYQETAYKEEAGLLKQQIDENKQSLRKVTQQLDSLEKRIEKKTEEQEELLKNQEQNENRLHELQLENAEQQERYRHAKQHMKSLQANYQTTDDKLQEVLEQLDEIASFEKQVENIEKVEVDLERYKEKREKIAREIADLQAKRKNMLQAIEDEAHELKSQEKMRDQFAQQLQEKEIQASRLDVMLENRLQSLQNEYTMTYEKASQMYPKVDDLAREQEAVKQLKSKIEGLGTVNLGAIDEYARLQEREAFLNEQRQDLIEAKNTLYEAIQKMDQEMVARFKTTFEQIQSAFSVVFRQLFGGGHAELVLTDPTNYLETGIDIIARPPGKKLKTLELLSGGERALTAIALLFAILRARPVPFVILDEVDAALDEANVERFANYLKTFSTESQFVVISHRKGTMEAADALYGVTMQESGVSRMVSVKLEEADHLVNSPT